MKKLLAGAAALLTTLTGALASASPAQAEGSWGRHGGGFHGGYGGGYGYRGGYGHRGGGAGGAVFAGLAGLAVGAALAHPHGYYGPPRVYYGPPPAYYAGPYYYGWYEGCRGEWVWNARWGGYQLVEACF